MRAFSTTPVTECFVSPKSGMIVRKD